MDATELPKCYVLLQQPSSESHSTWTLQFPRLLTNTSGWQVHSKSLPSCPAWLSGKRTVPYARPEFHAKQNVASLATMILRAWGLFRFPWLQYWMGTPPMSHGGHGRYCWWFTMNAWRLFFFLSSASTITPGHKAKFWPVHMTVS